MACARPYRALIFDEDESVRKMLWRYFAGRRYEVFTFPHPAACALCDSPSCACPVLEACADLIISDLNAPFMPGLDFRELQIQKGCKCTRRALMSEDIAEADTLRAGQLGIKLRIKPFKISEVDTWVKLAEGEIPGNRVLADWFLKEKR